MLGYLGSNLVVSERLIYEGIKQRFKPHFNVQADMIRAGRWWRRSVPEGFNSQCGDKNVVF